MQNKRLIIIAEAVCIVKYQFKIELFDENAFYEFSCRNRIAIAKPVINGDFTSKTNAYS